MINFNSAIINSQEIRQSFIWQTSENYLNIGQKNYSVVQVKGKEVSVKTSETKSHLIFTIMKIISFLTIVPFVLALVAREYYRRSYKYLEVNLSKNSFKELKAQTPLAPPEKVKMVAYQEENILTRLQEASNKGLKLGLFVGRLATQSLPEEKGWIWCSLDNVPIQELADNRLHLEMDFNDKEKLKKIQNLFNKVVCDFAVIQNLDDPWHDMKSVLVNKSDSEIVADACCSKGIAPGGPVKINPKKPYITVPIEYRDLDFSSEVYSQIQAYLSKLFQNVELKHGFYPYREGEEARNTKYWSASNPLTHEI